jgi:hypothetical protein
MPNPMLITRFVLAVLLAFPVPSGSAPWEKPPEQWNEAEVYRILRESPWCASKSKLESNYKQRHTDPQSGIVTDTPANPQDTGPVPGVSLTKNAPLPDVTVFWWSAKTIRLAQLRLRQLKYPAGPKESLSVEPLPDYVIAIEGSEPFRILSEAKEDLHDTVFLELAGGIPLDLQSVKFVEATIEDDARVEFHFQRQIEDRLAIEPDSPRVIFHCKATVKNPRAGRQNVLAFHSEFHPNEMKVRGVPDL